MPTADEEFNSRFHLAMDRTEENLKGVRSLIMLTLRRRRTHNTCVLDGVRPDGPGLVESILSKA